MVREGWEPLEVNVTVSRLHTQPNLLGLVALRDVSQRRSLEVELRKTQASLAAALDTTTNELRHSEQWTPTRSDQVTKVPHFPKIESLVYRPRG